ncbi:MAG: NlpC/P60 family protein [Balneolaceae bacterium]
MTSPEKSIPAGLLIAAAVLVSTLSACGVTGRTAPAANTGSVTAAGPESAPAGTSRSLTTVQKKLYQVHEEWRGTPYVLGGSDYNGVDCSSFIQIVFTRHFDVDMPRNTRQQIREGRGVRRNSVRPGDLIFFRTTRRDLHVGIAVNRSEFVHASTSAGVMISDMNERYWASRFLGVRRVL